MCYIEKNNDHAFNCRWKWIFLFYFNFPGDPSDRTLRKVEIEVMIPKLVRERSKIFKCSELKKGMLYTFIIYLFIFNQF